MASLHAIFRMCCDQCTCETHSPPRPQCPLQCEPPSHHVPGEHRAVCVTCVPSFNELPPGILRLAHRVARNVRPAFTAKYTLSLPKKPFHFVHWVRHRPQRGRHHNTARPHAHHFAAATAPAAARLTRQMRGPWTRLRRRCRCLRRSLCCLPAYRSARPASQAVRACVDKGRSRSTRTRRPGRSATVARSDACPGCRSGRSPAPRLRRIWCHAARRSAVLRRDAGLAACP